jgi:predicted heme/steroid binding protein
MERSFTEHELKRYDGEDGPVYIACDGIVYDVSGCYRWRTGLHENLHFAGQNLTHELVNAPHNREVFLHPCVKRVGSLLQPA